MLGIRIPILGALLFAGGCFSAGEEQGFEPITEDSAGVVIVTQPAPATEMEVPFTLEGPIVTLGTLAGPEDQQFGRVSGAVPLGDGSVAVMDATAREIRVFGDDGGLVRRIGGAGDGPGEFRIPHILHRLAADTLLVWDTGHGRLSWFAPDGELARDEVVSGRGDVGRVTGVLPMPDGTVSLIEVGGPPARERDEVRYREAISFIQWEGPDRLRTWAQVEGAAMTMRTEGSSDGMMMVTLGRQWFEPAHHVASAGSLLWRTDGMDWEIEGWNPTTGELERIVRLGRSPIPFDATFIQRLHDLEMERIDDPDARRSLVNRQRLRSYPEHVPPIRTLMGGADDRLWVGIHDGPPVNLPTGAGPEIQDWIVLESDGSVVGQVTLPSRSRLIWAGAEQLLLIRFDDLDLPFVERYLLQPEAETD